MIKRMLQVGLILAGSIAMPSWAVLVGGVDVGAVDTLIEVGDALGNPTDEATWVNSVLSPASTTLSGVKIEDVGIVAADGETDIFAFDMSPNAPDYFLVKNATMVALYENALDLMWGVFNTTDLGSAVDACITAGDCDAKAKINLPGDYTISHVTLFGEGGNGVPEPGVLGLLGIGLLGIIVGRRRMAA